MTVSAPRVTLLTGGVGGAKMAVGLARACQPDQLSIIGNVGDDQLFHGLWVSADIDTLTYTLAELIHPEQGWGLKDDTHNTLDVLGRLGDETWMFLGDKDFATHIYRTAQRTAGVRPSEIASRIATALGVTVPILLPTDDPLHTEIETNEGWLSFQDYFVRLRCQPTVRSVRFRGAESACATPEALAAVEDADIVFIAPSNPVVSIAPILAVSSLKAACTHARGYRIAVSPLIGGTAVKGPTEQMMRASGFSCDSFGVAASYAGLIDALVIDEQDAADAPALREQGLDVLVTPTLMRNDNDKIRLAQQCLAFAERQRSRVSS